MYKIPLLHEPKSVFLNNKSSYTHTNFPENAVSELISGGLVREVSSAPPCSETINCSMEMIILDLGHVNKQVSQSKIKFEDWRTKKQCMKIKINFGFIFDLKSGYHHINIFPLH